ncbi:MAG TPA: phage baseplate assembly protein V [Bryobacteraceae bacterium]|nr:phage baseplate assembly protein V [Bryobacteraceae bacterium]
MTDDALLRWIRSHFFGKYRGTVSDTNDPTTRGRLKVKVPSVLGDLEVWAMPCVPYAGSQVGFFTLPDTGTGVWIEFEAGDPSYPVWTGFFWGDGDLPSEATGASVKVWKTGGVTITIDDDVGKITIVNQSDAKLTIANDIEMEVSPSAVTIAATSITTECTTGKVEVSPAGVSVNDGALQVL